MKQCYGYVATYATCIFLLVDVSMLRLLTFRRIVHCRREANMAAVWDQTMPFGITSGVVKNIMPFGIIRSWYRVLHLNYEFIIKFNILKTHHEDRVHNWCTSLQSIQSDFLIFLIYLTVLLLNRTCGTISLIAQCRFLGSWFTVPYS